MKVFRFFTTLALIFLSLSSYADGMSIFTAVHENPLTFAQTPCK